MNELAKIAYETYTDSAGRGRTRIPSPEYEGLPKVEQRRWEAAADNVLRLWFETAFKAGINDDKFLEESGLRMIVVGQRRGEAPLDVLRTAITAIVADIVAPGELDAAVAALQKQKDAAKEDTE